MKRLASALALAAFCLIGSPANAYTIATFGDSSGSDRADLACNSNEQIVGLTIRAGTYVDSIRLMCALADSSGALGTPRDGPGYAVRSFASGLAGVSSSQGTFLCPSGYVLSGITAKSGDWVDRIVSLRCTRFGGTETRRIAVGMGGGGGTQAIGNCRDNDQIVTIVASYGSWTNRLVVTCNVQRYRPPQTSNEPGQRSNEPVQRLTRPQAENLPVRRSSPIATERLRQQQPASLRQEQPDSLRQQPSEGLRRQPSENPPRRR